MEFDSNLTDQESNHPYKIYDKKTVEKMNIGIDRYSSFKECSFVVLRKEEDGYDVSGFTQTQEQAHFILNYCKNIYLHSKS